MIKIYLAPLKGFTDHIFRTVYARNFKGVDLAVAPFIPTTGEHKISSARVRDILPENNENLKVIPQLLSNNPQDIIHLANYIYDLGYDEINLNLGCPHKNVTSKNKGSSLLADAYQIDKMLEKVLKGIKSKLSLKIRNGYYSHTEIFELIPVFNRYPLSEIIVHPRTGQQNYNGSVNLKTFGESYKKINSEIVYNGDIFTKNNYIELSNKFNTVKRWMLGRGVMFNPFLPSEIKNISYKDDNLTKLKIFHDDLSNTYRTSMNGPAHYLDRMKGIWFFLSQSFENGRKLLKKIQKSKGVSQYESIVESFFDDCPKWISGDYRTDRKKY